jgi:ribonuclease HI
MYADGACSGNGTESARAGWAFTVYADEGESTPIYQEKGRLAGERQTNNRAELQAVLKALKWIDSDSNKEYTIYSDSEMVVKGITGEASRNANRDIWEHIESICDNIIASNKSVLIQHVKGHADNTRHNYCDSLAVMASRALLLIPA